MTRIGAPRPVPGVAELLSEVVEVLGIGLRAHAVRGELSAFVRASSGHCYFTLKDADGRPASLRCAMFRRAATLLDFEPRDGQLVELRGRVSVYEQRGELQFVVEGMQRAGAGALYERFIRLRSQLEARGYFDPGRKRTLAPFPRRIGVVTSLDGAAMHDVVTCLTRRAPHLEIVVYPSVVQGAEAPIALCRAIDLAGRRAEVDILIVCRGGGSIEDLWSFNDERVVHAIASSPIPILTGIGHETDTTLADLAADVRAATPTAAAEIVSPSRLDGLKRLDACQGALTSALRRRLDGHAQRVDRLAVRLVRPGQLVHRESQRLRTLAGRLATVSIRARDREGSRLRAVLERLQRAAGRLTERQHQRLDAHAHRLRALDPADVLRRGYAWLTDEDGGALTSVASIALGSRVHAVLSDGVVVATVAEIREREREG